jgi:hypothetical protein
MKLYIKSIIAIAALVLSSTNVWAEEEFTFIYQLDGSASTEAAAGTVTASISGSTATLTVTPKEGNYFEAKDIKVYKTIDGQFAQSRRRAYNNIGAPIELTLQGTADMTGETIFTFEITDENFDYEVTANFKSLIDISNATVTLEEDEFTYDGTEKEPSVEDVVLGQTTIDSEYYDVSYENNIDAADFDDADAPTVIVTATKAPYTGEAKVTFTIHPNASSEMIIKLGEIGYVYDGKDKEPEVTVTVGDETLTAGKDYEVDYSDNVNAGTATVTVTGMGNYEGSEATANFEILKADLTPTVTLEGWTYGETAKEPTVTGNDGNGEVTYTYKQKDANDTEYAPGAPTNAGDYTVMATIAETQNYNGATATADFTISQAVLQVSYDQVEVEATLGGTINLPQLNLDPQAQGMTATWQTSDEEVATVSADGTVEIVGVGTATITVTVNGGANYVEAVTASYQLTVRYGLWVNGIQVDATNRKNVLKDGNESVKFDGKNTLILTNCATGSVRNELVDKLIIFLKGANELTTISGGDTLVIDTEENHPGTLSLKAEKDEAVISGYSKVILTGNLEWREGSAEDSSALIGVKLVPLGDGEERSPGSDYFVVEDGEAVFNKVIDNVLYTFHVNPSDDGDGYEEGQGGEDEGGLVLNTTLTPEDVLNALKKELGSDEFAKQFTGIAFMLPSGMGFIDFDVFVGSAMMVKIGNQDPIVIPAMDGEVSIPYTCAEPTLVLVWNGADDKGSQGARHAKVKTTTVKIRDFKVSSRRAQESSEPDEDAAEENILTEFNPADYVDGVYTPADSTLTGLADGLFVDKDVKCIDLSHTKIRNMTVKHGEGAFAGVDAQVMIYMPVRNEIAEDEQNVVIGTVCESMQMNFSHTFFRALKEFGVVDMTLDENLDEKNSAAIYWPFGIPSFAMNMMGDFYTVKGMDEDEVLMAKIEGDLAANTPCVFVKKTEGALALENVLIEPVKEQPAGYLVGGYEMPYVTITASEPLYQYVALDGEEKGVFIPISSNELKPYTAYLRATAEQQQQLAVRWTGNPLTGIRMLTVDEAEADGWYTLQGVKVEGTPKKAGIYLYRGKKTIVQ